VTRCLPLRCGCSAWWACSPRRSGSLFEKLVGAVAFIAGLGAVLGLGIGYVRGWGVFRDTIGWRPVDVMPWGYGARPRLIEFATVGIVIVVLVVVSAWLLARGTARARRSASAREPAGD